MSASTYSSALLKKISSITLTQVFFLHSILAATYGIFLLFTPHLIIQLLTTDHISNVIEINFAQLFGAVLITVGVIAWQCSRMTDRQSQKVIAVALCSYTTIGTFIATHGQLSRHWNALGWSSVFTYAILAVAYTFCLIRRNY